MQYVKQADGTLKELPQKNIDFGGGLTRLEAAVRDDPDMFNISSLAPVIKEIEKISEHSYSIEEHRPSMRVIADHLTAASFLIKDGIFPSNKGQGYVLRRLLRRAAIKLYFLTDNRDSIVMLPDIVRVITKFYGDQYFNSGDFPLIQNTITVEISKFSHSLDRGLKELQKNPQVDGKFAFDLYQNYGFPLEVTAEILSQMGKQVDIQQFQIEFEKHKELSRTASAGMFKGGLADHSNVVTAYHTATHLLHSALRQILGTHVQQKGSNITSERLRFDFSHPEKLSDIQVKAVQDLINQKISERLIVTKEELPKEKALEQGALAFFGQKYSDIVTVYTIGDKKNYFSKELCGGPHVESLAELAKINIVKQESLGAGTRRLYLQFV